MRCSRVARGMLCAAAMTVGLVACGGGSTTGKAGGTGTTGPGATAPAHRGGSLHVLENTANFGNWPGLDPATDTSDAADHDYLNAIYGELFEEGPKGAVPDLATGYQLSSDLKTLRISLRHGVTFTDGTAFDADAVLFNLRRDLDPKNGCLCLANFPVASMSAPDAHTVVLQLSRPFAPIVSSFFSEAPNWIVSPTALQKMGEKAFALTPVGAGPFEVVTNSPSSVLKLARNPHYWQPGRPLLDSLTFTTVGTDQSAFDALRAGQAQAYEAFSTYSLLPTVRKALTVTAIIPSPTGTSAVQLNTTQAPFDNITAREAMYYATDPGPIDKALYGGLATPTQSLRAPGQLFFEPTVPGYRTYDLAKAKALVQQVGGLHLTLDAEPSQLDLATALAGEWNRAGIVTSIHQESFEQNIADYKTDSWQVKLAAGGGYEPAIGLGLNFWYASHAPFTGIHDPALDQLIAEGVSVASPSARAAVYRRIYQYLSDKAYSPVLFFAPLFDVSVRGVAGPGFTSQSPEILWEDVSAG